MNRSWKPNAVLICFVAFLAGCANTDVVLRPERTTYIPAVQTTTREVKIAGDSALILRCLNWKGKTDTGASSDEQCLYFSADEQEIFAAFSAQSTANTDIAMKNKRNLYTSFLLNLSDQNCSTFLGRAFANKSSFDTGRNIMQDVITGSTAAAANASPPTAAGLSLANLVIGKSVDNVNTTFYFEKTFQALAAAIGWQREIALGDIEKMKTESYEKVPIYDVLGAVRKYDDACSIRVGLAKLQELAQEAKQGKKVIDDTKKELQQKEASLVADRQEVAALSAEVSRLYKVLEDGFTKPDTKPSSNSPPPARSTAIAKAKVPLETIIGKSSAEIKTDRLKADSISTTLNSKGSNPADLKSPPK